MEGRRAGQVDEIKEDFCCCFSSYISITVFNNSYAVPQIPLYWWMLDLKSGEKKEGQIEGWKEGGRFRGMGSRRVGRGRKGRWLG
jgi:hypothetical protein